jgi:hypothetical protein
MEIYQPKEWNEESITIENNEMRNISKTLKYPCGNLFYFDIEPINLKFRIEFREFNQYLNWMGTIIPSKMENLLNNLLKV